MAHRDLGEAHLAGDLGQRRLVGGVAVAVHQDDRDGAEAGREGRLEAGPRLVAVERRLDRAVGAHPLLDLDDVAVELLGQHDVAREDVGAVLVADAQRVAQALRDGQHGGRALALEERVGGDGGAHLDGVDLGRGQRLVLAEPEAVADALDRRVRVVLGVLGEQLSYRDLPVRGTRHDVGERAATVDPELPAAHAPLFPPGFQAAL